MARDELDIPVNAVAALLDISEHMAVSVLGALADVHLIEPSGNGYHFDPLVKLFARPRTANTKDVIEEGGPGMANARKLRRR